MSQWRLFFALASSARSDTRPMPGRGTAWHVFPTVLLIGLVVALASTRTVQAQEDALATMPAHQLEIAYVGDVPYQMYVERRTPLGIPIQRNALIFVHGNGVTGTMWDHTPDNRDGWATYFLRQGFTTYVVDLPGHGRSPMPPYYATMGLERAVSAVQSLLLRAGPSIVVGHSLGGNIATRVTGTASPEVRSNIAGVVLLAPGRVNELLTTPLGPAVPETEPFRWSRDVATTLTATDTFPQNAMDQFLAMFQPESARIVNQSRQPGASPPAGGPSLFSGIPTVVIGAEQDKNVTPATIQAYSDYFGIPAVMVGADWGLAGHGHPMLIELGNTAIAEHLMSWFKEQGLQ